MSNPTKEPTEIDLLHAEVKHYKAVLDGCDKQLAEVVRELHKTKCELIRFLDLPAKNEKYRYNPIDYATVEEWCKVANDQAAEVRTLLEQRNYWREEYERATKGGE